MPTGHSTREAATIPPHIEKLAEVIQRLTPQELEQLRQLAPKLGRSPDESSEERAAIDYVRTAAMELTGGAFPKRTDEFIEGLTYQEYFALSEKEQDALWERIFTEEGTGPYTLEEIDEPSNSMATG